MGNKINGTEAPLEEESKCDIKDEVGEYLDQLNVSVGTLEQLIANLEENFKSGLAADGSEEKERGTIKMLPTYVRAIPDGTESGDYFALDLGGTNFRVLHVQIQDREITSSHESYPVSEALMTGKGEDLFDFIAEKLAIFAKQKLGEDVEKISAVGFTFSFPVDQKSLYSGNLIKWTKGYNASGVEGEDIVALLNEAIARRQEIEVEKVVLINDTTGVMMCGAFQDKDVALGLILGTGTNACYMEQIEAVKKWDGDSDEPREVIINTEWGAYGDKGDLAPIQTKNDVLIDENSINKGNQLFEKMISGMYLGRLAQLCIIDLVEKNLLFGGKLTPELKDGSFDTRYVSEICSSGNAKLCVDILTSFGYGDATIDDCKKVERVCYAVSLRAATLAASGLASIIRRIKKNPVAVAVDGTLFKKHPLFQGCMQDILAELLPDYTVRLGLAEDGSGVGAALAAAVAKRLDSSK